ncbi:pyridoxamine 5'-phosphate oxidase family protein [Aneurinibacillus terranovensis]|uniref:pyridoxamine 5'-phosphate oxidase family protein n=1 Tax=Aneurinibacillus terranovensis TaxID=278991 RepID=UPI000481EF13|nr:pyridoxamine 5'-phosphate oxidase family protein [Aneurinibacillus terranovensis]
MRHMRRTVGEMNDPAEIEKFLHTARVGYLGLVDNEGTYVVPLNFVWHEGYLYFHGSQDGRKIDALNHPATVCFTVAEEYGTIADPIPAHTDTAYKSVMVFGKPERVASLDEATEVLQAMLDKYVPGYYPASLAQSHVDKYRSNMGSRTVVYRIIPEHVTGKSNPVNTDRMFFTGRTQQDDLKC